MEEARRPRGSVEQRDSNQGETGNREVCFGHLFRVTGLGHQVSGAGNQVQVRVRENQVLSLHPNLKTRTRLPIAETRDLKMSAAANPPISGSPLS